MVCYLRPTKGRENTITHFSGNKSRLITRHIDPLHAAIRLLMPKQPNCSSKMKYSAYVSSSGEIIFDERRSSPQTKRETAQQGEA